MKDLQFPSTTGKKRCLDEDDQPIGNILKRPKELMPAVAGKVMCIELENFMCHNKLRLNFDVDSNNCFYIIGPNGSGKSALFAGLNIGLGGTGRSNERGKTLHSYIKDGKSDAHIRIYLSNEGPNACANFDEVVVVERHITEKATNFTLKTSAKFGGRERVVSRKRAELDALLEQFGIELDNPLAWLSQDRSRQFLQQMKPEKLYQLYRKTAEMDSTDLMFQSIEAHFDEFCRVFDSLAAEKKAREENYIQMKNRHKASREIKDKKVERQRLLWYNFWAPIRDNITRVNGNRAEIGTLSTEKVDLLEQIQQHMAQKDKLIQKQQSLLPQKEEEVKKCKQQHEKIMEMKRKVHELEFEITDLKRDHQKRTHQKMAFDKDIGEANAKLAAIIGDSTRNIGDERQSLEEQNAEIEQKIQAIEKDKEPKISLQQEMNKNYQERKKQLQEHTSELHQLERRRDQLREEKNTLASSKVNRLALFGANMPKLVKLIEMNRESFRRLPIGPIGSFIKLRDQKWANAVEFHMKKTLSAFICDSSEDRAALDDIFKRNGLDPPEIITAAFSDTKFDIRDQEPPSEYLTIERVLTDDIEPTVYNILVDLKYIESTLLVEKDEEARNIMYPQPPSNVSMAITMLCSQVYPARGRQPYRFFANNGQFRSRALAQRFLAQDPAVITAQLRQIEHQIVDEEIVKNKHEQKVRGAGHALSEVNSTISEFDRQLNQLTEQRFKVEDELQKLDQLCFSGEMIDNLQGTIREISKQRAQCTGQLNELNTKYAQKTEEQKETKRQIDEADKKVAYLKNNVNQIENDIDSFDLQQRKIDEKIENCEIGSEQQQKKIDKLQKEITNWENENTELQQHIASMELAPDQEEFPPDLTKIPPTDELKRNLREIERFIKTEENNHDPVPTVDDLLKKADEYKKFKKDYEIWSRRKQKLEEMKDCRKRRFLLLKASLPQKIASDFRNNMSMRNFYASLNINDERQLVEIRVERPGTGGEKTDDEEGEDGHDDMQRPSTSRKRTGAATTRAGTTSKRILQDLRGLSGGERSFTTVSFVMALWNSCMESPFRCSDEFDVFMDPVNRRFAMEMLAELAKENRHIQFFFFTPQGIMEMKNDELQLQVFELKRIAGLLDDGQQPQEEEDGE
ncbi:hypothetical protein niasHS_006469 [Heterodera schachtii]|uniref:RecF/RecN/SMC N-terminal domain-containing protein n=1 Tax=Heterodera schachtii TaxID=97005 RepID=A0ABD2JHF6_HETSC